MDRRRLGLRHLERRSRPLRRRGARRRRVRRALPHRHRRRDLSRRHRPADSDGRAVAADRGDERRDPRLGDNGEPFSLAHGGPLRLVVPGYQGVNNVKYVKRVALTANESPAAIQKTRYRLNAIGTQATPADPSVLGMTVKSFVTSPSGAEPVKAGVVYVTGVAFAGGSAIKRVEVSSDGGKTWIDAQFFGPDLGRFAWRQFAVPLRMAAGNYVLTSRATDAAAASSPSCAARTRPATPTRAGPIMPSRWSVV